MRDAAYELEFMSEATNKEVWETSLSVNSNSGFDWAHLLPFLHGNIHGLQPR